MVVKMNVLISLFQHKNRFEKQTNLALDILKNVLKLGEPNQTAGWKQFLIDISSDIWSFYKPIFELKPWNQDGCFDYYKSHKPTEFFFTKFGRVPQKWPKKPNLRENLTWSGQTGSHLGMWSPDHVESVKYPRHHSTFFVLYPVHVRMCKKDDICWQRRLKHSWVGGGFAFRRVYPAWAYTTVVVCFCNKQSLSKRPSL